MPEPEPAFLACPFWIDTSGYSNRDRDMFVAGFEYGLIYCNLITGRAFSAVFAAENFDRVRMLLDEHKRKYRVVTIKDDYMRFDVLQAGR